MQGDEATVLKAGAVIDGRYRIEALLGEGGFAEVYRAQHLVIGRPAALKLLRITGRGEQAKDFQARFVREAQVAARLTHPNVVVVYDFGFHGEAQTPYLAMELLQGHDLDAELQRAPLPFARAQRLFLPVLDALGKAHQQGIVHKDLKPSNLFLVAPGTPEEQLKILDFGIAREADQGAHTRTGQYFGTPQYLAPEYIESNAVTPALDVYQMALVLIEALAGESNFHDSSPLQCVAAHLQGNLEAPAALLDSPLAPLLRRALASDPKARHADAHALRDDLATIDAARIPLLARPAPRRAVHARSGEQPSAPPQRDTGALALSDTQDVGALARALTGPAAERPPTPPAAPPLRTTPAPAAPATPPEPLAEHPEPVPTRAPTTALVARSEPTPPAPTPQQPPQRSRAPLLIIGGVAALGLLLVGVAVLHAVVSREPPPTEVARADPDPDNNDDAEEAGRSERSASRRARRRALAARREGGAEKIARRRAPTDAPDDLPREAVELTRRITRAEASSTLPDWQEYTFGVDNLFDGRLDTSWQPNDKVNHGVGQTIILSFPGEVTLTAIELANGFQRNDRLGDLFTLNSRARNGRLIFSDGSSVAVTFDTAQRGFHHVPLTPTRTRRLTLTIDTIHPGTRWPDLALSELRVFGYE